jgi:CheY-like chemotaxis protein
MIDALVVEDDVDIWQLLIDQLEDKGCRVKWAGNGSSGLRRLKQSKPDIIFVDIVMPVMDGIEFIEALKADPETSDIPVVLLTAVSAPAVTMRAIKLGVKFRVTKPWEPHELDYVYEQSLGLDNDEVGTSTKAVA